MAEEGTKIIGVDFSGGGTDKSKGKTWICSGEFDGKALELEDLRQISRQELKAVIKKSDDATVIALDFPFAVPESFLKFWGNTDCEVSSAEKMPDLWKSTKRLKKTNRQIIDWCKEFINQRKKAKEDPVQPKRVCDESYPESLSPLNLRMSLMTIQGMRLLHDLWEEGSCRVLPLHCPKRSGPKLLEVMPGAVLKTLKLPYKTYKSGPSAFVNRRKILDKLPNRSPITITNLSSFRDHCMFSDDCLDAIVAALAASLWHSHKEVFRHPDKYESELAQKEGWLYNPCPSKLYDLTRKSKGPP